MHACLQWLNGGFISFLRAFVCLQTAALRCELSSATSNSCSTGFAAAMALSLNKVDRFIGIFVSVCAGVTVLALTSYARSWLVLGSNSKHGASNAARGGRKKPAQYDEEDTEVPSPERRRRRWAVLLLVSCTCCTASQAIKTCKGCSADVAIWLAFVSVLFSCRRQDRDRFRDAESDAYHEYMHGRKSGAASTGPLVLHKGGCHCGSMTFEVEAPAHLAAVEGASKLRYPFITVPGECTIFHYCRACSNIQQCFTRMRLPSAIVLAICIVCSSLQRAPCAK
jgi:hypothetical protein